ncbi:HipA domain-containing protein [Cellulomonas sp. SLBN-39]|uniref:HipA domain-containing protein n=1 Tax=Cellulomonas sp. SLBN-39 TaxID=2768446 RepID=UPI00114EF783|nr:HipA domain-containing protein [Cellulomonas sp. SLBN-39]TQL02676.1 serine/threonine-protein kinase HipA [Cellulomonas sp. SLBN-39]
MTGTLHVWLNDVHVADLLDAGMGAVSVRYTDDAVERYGPGAIALSVRMPVRPEPYPAVVAQHWLDGLLPEETLRKALADRYRIAENDTTGLLGRIGRECAGAVVITPPDADPPTSAGVHWLDEAALERTVDDLAVAPFGVGADEHVRVSLGGVQEKLVLVRDPTGRLGLPLEATPSTHILKPAPIRADGEERWPGVVHGELFAMRAMRLAGVPTADVQLRHVGARPGILVERYDRRRVDDRLVRIHQEDMCQALGIPPTSKYQQAQDPMSPSLAKIAAVLSTHADAPVEELRALAALVTGSLVLGNCDQHAKNISLLLDPERGVRLAPAYDVVPTTALPGTSTELSMRIGGEAFIDDLSGEALVAELGAWDIGERAARRIVSTALDRLEPAIEDARAQVADEAGDHPVLDLAVRQAHERITRMRR